MWGLFFAAAFAGALFLFVPGALVLAGLRMHVASVIAFAPLLGIPATIALCLAYAALGINTNWVLFMSFAMSAALGAIGGILVAPITMASYDMGIMLGLKGFVGAVVGGLGNGLGAVLGGLIVGILEAMGAGYISSAYKDAIPFVLILLMLFFMPRGLFGGKSTDRV